VESWKGSTAWIVGRYVLMPDHLHLICSPIDEEVEIEALDHFLETTIPTYSSRADALLPIRRVSPSLAQTRELRSALGLCA
ncbi:MAG: hypothetical protein M3429_01750, partial [Verrucomicrobiota bacterium]|nr:hypothetical protein [Verrucomicrobiota bacterium]